MAAVASGKGCPVALLKRNNPVFYCVPAAVYEALLERLDDQELIAVVWIISAVFG